MNTTGPIARVRVTGDGKNVTGQAGTHLLGRIASRFGLTAGLSKAMAGTTQGSSAHDRGTVLTQLPMMTAAAGSSRHGRQRAGGCLPSPTRQRSCWMSMRR